MTTSSDRRAFIRVSAGLGVLAALGIPGRVMAQAAASGQLTIAFPTDVPTWDAVQSLYKMLFDQPLDQAPDLSVKPNLIAKWGFVDTNRCRSASTFAPTRSFTTAPC